MAKPETTGTSAASNAGRVLRSETASPAEKSAAGSALTQLSRNDGLDEHTSKKAASNAGRVLRDNTASPEARSAAGSALTQVPDRKKAK